ncbi:MAG: B12-binding domain-containing radical SAM protein [Bacteroidales bacterium]|nr:B12-binding domain-containing radical SAM protein [Bacteroidales bacterium]
MNILLVHPKYPTTYWSYKHALKFISKKATNPPLGLLTVASLLPPDWNKKLVDMNVTSLRDKDLLWADYVYISAMSVQMHSVKDVISKCKLLKKKIVAGGPLFTAEFESFKTDVDHLILNEAEITLPHFLDDLQTEHAKKIYHTDEYADITTSPVPDFSLIDVSKYAMLNLQYTRGCPFNCEFCDITALLGHKVRLKTTAQIIDELDNIKKIGWKGPVFFVDDNFIGNKSILKKDLLPAIINWMHKNNNPFIFTTEASINLADDQTLMQMMVQAGFAKVFIGIETPDEASLAECNKFQNNNRDLVQSVKAIQSAGMEVMAGFIVGFDHDTPSIFQRQIDFIQKSGIISAMVGLLNAPRKTQLYKRLMHEGRITNDWSGDNTNYSLNFIPVMNKQELLNGYQKILHGIYSSKAYYKRIGIFFKNFSPPENLRKKLTFIDIIALFKSMIIIGVFTKSRWYYWELFFWCVFRKPELFPLAITYSIYGYHYRRVFKGIS